MSYLDNSRSGNNLAVSQSRNIVAVREQKTGEGQLARIPTAAAPSAQGITY